MFYFSIASKLKVVGEAEKDEVQDTLDYPEQRAVKQVQMILQHTETTAV
jgi:hypothetical protein